jgi:predicted SnoaL-like aldol condensation-catalyzing enzyme
MIREEKLMQKSELERKQHVLRFMTEVLHKGNLSELDALVSADYEAHVPRLAGMPLLHGGRVALRERLAAIGAVSNRVFRVIADGDLVFAQTRYEGVAPVAGVDIFRFGGEEETIVEHWSVRQPIADEVSNKYDRYAGGGDTGALVTRAQRERQKQLVRNLYTELWCKGNAELVSRFYTPTYIQHNPHIESGSARIKRIIETDIAAFIARSGRDYPIEIHLLGCEGDLVFAYCSITMAGLTRNEGDLSETVDIFRVDAAGKLCEHWDVLQMESEGLPGDAMFF